MKLRKMMSLTTALAVVMTCIATVFTPVASAAPRPEVNTTTEYRDSFDNYGAQNYANTLNGLKAYGWYACDQTKLYTDVSNTSEPYSTMGGKFAKIDTDKLYITSAGESSGDNIKVYGYGKTFPGVATDGVATGVWEINFDFKPFFYNNNTQFAFTLNTADGSATGTNAEHNIISGYGTNFYIGYRDYNKLMGIPQGTIPVNSSTGAVWYSVKTILNCDAKYYSVELYDKTTGKLIARRSPISFAGNETISFLKFSALGIKQRSIVYVDNVLIKKTERETLIYNEDFESYPGVTLATSGVTTGGATENVSGSSYFEGYTPWRANTNVGNYHTFTTVSQLGKVVGLGGSSGSGLVYMPVYDKLVDSTTQATRGMVKTSFKIKPASVGDAGVKVNAIADYTQDITSDSFAVFKIENNNGTPAVNVNGTLVNLNSSVWYNVDLIFDVKNKVVTTAVKNLTYNKDVVSFSKDMALTALKGIMFNVSHGSSVDSIVYADDIKIEYYKQPVFGIKAVAVESGNTYVTPKSFGAFITDGTGEDEGKKVVHAACQVYYNNPTDSSVDALAAISCFDQDGRFLGVRQASTTFAAGANGYTNITPVKLVMDGTPTTVKVSLWDNFANANPYCSAWSYSTKGIAY